MASTDYENSICFSSRIPEELNQKVFLIDKRLFLFAYYEPKDYISKESFRSRFRTAIINLYGLFKDCSPFLKSIHHGRNSILTVNCQQYINDFDNLFNLVCAFRSIFCHNNSDVFPLNEVHYIYVDQWISSRCAIYKDLSDLNESDWENMLSILHSQANAYICSLEMNIDKLLSMQGAGVNINSVILQWISGIAKSYIDNKDYLLNAMVNLYQLYLSNARIYTNPTIPTRADTKKWLVSDCGAPDKNRWYDKWVPNNSSGSSLYSSRPYQILINWPNYWATYNGRTVADCNEAPMPGGDFFRIVASDVDNYAHNPKAGYNPTLV